MIVEKTNLRKIKEVLTHPDYRIGNYGVTGYALYHGDIIVFTCESTCNYIHTYEEKYLPVIEDILIKAGLEYAVTVVLH